MLGALALHGLVLSLRVWHRPVESSLNAKVPAATQSVELQEFPVEEAPPEPALAPSPPNEPSAPTAVAGRVAALPARSINATVEASAEPAPAGDALAAPIADGSTEAGDARPGRKIDLGLDGRFFLHEPAPANSAEPSAASELGPRARKSTMQRQLEAALSADDVARGLARGNALVASPGRHECVGPLAGTADTSSLVVALNSAGAQKSSPGNDCRTARK